MRERCWDANPEEGSGDNNRDSKKQQRIGPISAARKTSTHSLEGDVLRSSFRKKSSLR